MLFTMFRGENGEINDRNQTTSKGVSRQEGADQTLRLVGSLTGTIERGTTPLDLIFQRKKGPTALTSAAAQGKERRR